MRKPFFWAARNAWFLRVKSDNGKLTNQKLAEEQDEAFAIWQSMIEREKRLANADSLIVADLIDMYASHLEERVRDDTYAQTTLDRRMYQLSSFLCHPGMSVLSVQEIKPFHVLAWLSANKAWNSTTKHDAAKAVKSAFNWSTKIGRIDRNPIVNVSVESGESRDFLVTPELYRKLIDGTSDGRLRRKRVRSFRLILMAVKMTGCRPGELLELKVEHVGKDTWEIDKHKNRRKTKRLRVIYPCPCMETLAKIASSGRTSGPMFVPESGNQWTYSKLRTRMDRLKKRVKAPAECVLYSFRHTSITDSLLAEIEIATVAEIHGTSIKMIQTNYAHLCQHQNSMKAASLKLARHRRANGF